MRIRWGGLIEQRRLELLKNGLNYKQIANILSKEFGLLVTYRSVENRSYKTNTLKNSFVSKINNEIQIIENDSDLFPTECYDINTEMCMTPDKLKELDNIYNILTKLKPKKVLSLSDLHAPFINFRAVEKAISAHPDADICLLNGDVYDGQGMSSFDKMKEIDLEEELKQVIMLLDVLTKRYKHVVWVGGNHDMGRFMSFVMRNFASGMKNYVLKRLNPIDYIAEKYDNLIVVPHDWIQIGDVIFAHLQNYSNADMKTVTTNNEIFSSMRELLPNPNYKAVVIGHTHMLGKIIKNDILLMEQGCLCYLQDYKFMKPTKKKWQTGYAVIEFDSKTNVDFNKTNIVYLKD